MGDKPLWVNIFIGDISFDIALVHELPYPLNRDPFVFEVKEYHIGLNFLEDLYPSQLFHLLGQDSGHFVVFSYLLNATQSQSADVGQNTRLAESPPQKGAEVVEPVDELLAAHNDGSHRGTESFAEAEHHWVALCHQLLSSHFELGTCVEYPGTVHVDMQFLLPCTRQ